MLSKTAPPRGGDLGLAESLGDDVVDAAAYREAVRVLRERQITLPTFAELADPRPVFEALGDVHPDAPDPRNLLRIHWYNGRDRRERGKLPAHVVLPPALTGVDAPIVVLLGALFPMIGSHKLLAAYACLVPRLVTGRFNPASQRAVWPSTGNYCRGGVALSRILGCRGVAVLPEGMSAERFRWLEEWVADPGDIVHTPGSESNVREIYERCDELATDPSNVILNQFSEFGNHLVHREVTSAAVATVVESLREKQPALTLRAFVSASGSAGTIGAGDALKERYGARIVAVEALECPTLLMNGYGEHNIQGIGDKHVPLIHNVMNTDLIVDVSDRATDELNLAASTSAGRAYLFARGVPSDVVETLELFGLSSWCNVVAAIKTAKLYGLGPNDIVATIATDGAAMYRSEAARTFATRFKSAFDARDAAAAFERHLLGADTGDLLELDAASRRRIFNLGYYTWVEQRGLSLDDFEARSRPEFWVTLQEAIPRWDAAIRKLNAEVDLGALG